MGCWIIFLLQSWQTSTEVFKNVSDNKKYHHHHHHDAKNKKCVCLGVVWCVYGACHVQMKDNYMCVSVNRSHRAAQTQHRVYKQPLNTKPFNRRDTHTHTASAPRLCRDWVYSHITWHDLWPWAHPLYTHTHYLTRFILLKGRCNVTWLKQHNSTVHLHTTLKTVKQLWQCNPLKPQGIVGNIRPTGKFHQNYRMSFTKTEIIEMSFTTRCNKYQVSLSLTHIQIHHPSSALASFNHWSDWRTSVL